MDLNETFAMPAVTRRRPSELILSDRKSGMPIAYPQNPCDSIRRLYMSSPNSGFNDIDVSYLKESPLNNSSLRISKQSVSLTRNSTKTYDSFANCFNDLEDSTMIRNETTFVNHETAGSHQSTNQNPDPQKSAWATAFSILLLTFLAAMCLLVISVLVLILANTNLHERRHCSGHRHLNMSRLSTALDDLFGQHLASNIIISTMTEFVNSANTGHPLLLAFHGSTGVGKTYTARLLAAALTSDGVNVHWHLNNVESVRDWVLMRRSACNLDVFIFEDTDLYPGWVSLELTELLCGWTDLDVGSGGKSAIFITISNQVAQLINSVALEMIQQNGSRSNIRKEDFLLPGSDFVADCSHWQVFVPFLPLEKAHVIQCLEKIVNTRNLRLSAKEISEYATYSVAYFPDNFPIFSKLGCKQLKLD